MCAGRFSPRENALTVYITSSFEHHAELMAKLGKYTIGTSCLHIRRLTDVDTQVLKQLIARSLKAPLPGEK